MKMNLPPSIAERANAKRPGSVFAWLLLKKAVHDCYGLAKLPKVGIAAGGKPFFADRPDIHFSLSHNDSAAVCAVFDSELGCDIESAFRKPAAVLMEKVMTSGEKAVIGDSCEGFMRLWTMKEAKLKKDGLGLAGGIGRLDLTEALKNGSRLCSDIFTTIELDGSYVTVCAEKEVKDIKKVVL